MAKHCFKGEENRPRYRELQKFHKKTDNKTAFLILALSYSLVNSI